ncbi:hypothetical protein [Rhodospirillaceae bacterium SYSU D60014]|uniref:hypothetical protein n=1 Tax=Virgifigura deserti TaxID=2268457 RepID=UPI000E66A70E
MSAKLGEAPLVLRHKLFRIRETLQWQGVHGLTFRALMHSGYRSAGWFVRPLDAPVRPVEARRPARVGELTASDAEAYVAFRPELTETVFLSRLEAGHRCFVAFVEDRPASVVWVAVDSVRVEFFSRTLFFGEGEIYLYNAYTDPANRGAHLQPLLIAAILSRYQAGGFVRAFSLIGLHNRPKITVCERAGFRRLGYLGQVRLGPFRRDFFRGRRDEADDGATRRPRP